jgi:hypothetical protein
MRSKGFLVEILDLYGIVSYHLQIGTIWFLPSLFDYLVFISSVLLLWLKNFSTVDTLASFLNLEEKVLVFSHLVWCWLKVCHIAFIMLRNVPSIPSFFRAFIMKGCWILSETFSASIDMLMWICPWFCLCVVLHLLVRICCTILAFLEWNLLDHGAWSF